MHTLRRQTCRVCGSKALTQVIDLGEQHLQGTFWRPDAWALHRKVPMALARCNPQRDERACGLLQAEYVVPPEMMYRDYWYRSGVNSVMQNHLRELTYAVRRFVGPETGGGVAKLRVLDIGCNDATMLNYYPEHYDRWGVDPSVVAAEAAKAPENAGLHIVNDFFPSSDAAYALAQPLDGQPKTFDIITAVAMMYGLADPTAFMESVASWLAPEGVFVFEMSYMPAMLRQHSYDTVCHEHAEYYSLAVVENILARAKLRVVRVEENSMYGGSLRCYAVRATNLRAVETSVAAMRVAEFNAQLDTDAPYLDFQRRAEVHRDDLLKLLHEIRAARQQVHVYGANTKGNTLLQWCGIDSRLISYAADNSPNKLGMVTPGSMIPIIREEESRAMRPAYYLVLPWHFRKAFLERERESLAAGTRFIFPFPKIEVVGA